MAQIERYEVDADARLSDARESMRAELGIEAELVAAQRAELAAHRVSLVRRLLLQRSAADSALSACVAWRVVWAVAAVGVRSVL